MLFSDKLTLDKPRKTADGYLVTRAKAARTGVYVYSGAEVDPDNQHGLRDRETVNVLRDEATVFDKKAVHSFIGKPITDNHPHEAVNADNWRDHARGVIMGALKDGEHLAFDLLLTDADAIKAIDGGKRELSNGYAADLEFGNFTSADGTECQARQASIRGNHIAIVDRGRAGSECRIADAARCTSLPADAFELLLDERTYNAEPNDNINDPARRETSIPGGGLRVAQDGDRTVTTKTILIDGYQFEADAALEVAVTKLQNQLKDALDGKAEADKKVTDLTAEVSTKDGEVKALEQKLKDAEVKPEQLEQLAADRAALIATAKAIEPSVVTDGKTDIEIRKAVVDAKLGDTAKDMDDAAIGGAFKVLSKDVKQPDPVRDALTNGATVQTEDAKVHDAYAAMVDDLAKASQPKHLQTA
jgi:hypothetical protein